MTPESFESTEVSTLARCFVNNTSSHIFLTGKAGTGKTTFLRQLADSTHKTYVVAAPTGIAALNAQGVTLHSLFLFPFGTFLPGRDLPADLPEGPFFTQQMLSRKHPLNAARREVLRNIDLLIIDEVSMLRADLLDAIDFRLRSVRRNHQQSFGGVQVLFIGDLYQLPPVVKNHEWSRMREFYKSPHFFEAQCLQNDGLVYVELDKIFRQQNAEFISILNNLRDNTVTEQDVAVLNSRYQEGEVSDDKIITICTHNKQADSLNNQALKNLGTREHSFLSRVEGDFPDRIFPVNEELRLKKGARIMFVKNDSQEGRYYNGSLAEVVQISDDEIIVKLDDSGEEIELETVSWDNKRYKVNDESKEMEEDVIGTFSQYPVKLAWAITVHKSQGLTFEKAIIDVGSAFAPGQVYVALSRLTSLEGLILKTPISRSVVSSDTQVAGFSKKKDSQGDLTQLLQDNQTKFLHETLHSTFNFDSISFQIDAMKKKHDVSAFEDEEMQVALLNLEKEFALERKNSQVFRRQIEKLLQTQDYNTLGERVAKGSAYYRAKFIEQLEALLVHIAEVSQLAKNKAYISALKELDLLLMKKIESFDKSESFTQFILEGGDIEVSPELEDSRVALRQKLLNKAETKVEQNPKFLKLKTGKRRKKKGPKREKGATYKDTYELVKEGLDLNQIVEKRDLKASTIEGHFVKGIEEGALDIEQVLDGKIRNAIVKAINADDDLSMNELYVQLKRKYSFGQIRMVIADLKKQTAEE